MDATDRTKFEASLAELLGALDKPCGQAKADGFWKALEGMTWTQFCRARDQVLADLQGGEAPRTFTAGSLWAAYRKLRAHAPAPAPVSTWRGDAWDERAGLLLLAHIRNQAAKGVHYVCPRTRLGLHSATAEPTAETRDLTVVLVGWKNAWARDCRESDPPPDAATQLRWWKELMARAEVECGQVRAKYATAAA